METGTVLLMVLGAVVLIAVVIRLVANDHRRLRKAIADQACDSCGSRRVSRTGPGDYRCDACGHEGRYGIDITAETAIDFWRDALDRDPDKAGARDALRSLCRTAQKWNALLEILTEDLQRLRDDQVDEKLAILLEMVSIYGDNLELDVMVINTYNAILDLDESNEAALQGLADKYESLRRWNDLIGILSRQVAMLQDVTQRKKMLWRVAMIWKDRFSQLAKVRDTLKQILELDPDDADARSLLDRIQTS